MCLSSFARYSEIFRSRRLQKRTKKKKKKKSEKKEQTDTQDEIARP